MPKPSYLSNLEINAKTLVQDTHPNTSNLKQCLVDTWANVSQNIIDKAVINRESGYMYAKK